MVDTDPAMAGVEDDEGATVVIPGVVEEGCSGYRCPLGLHRHCPGTVQWRRAGMAFKSLQRRQESGGCSEAARVWLG
jgi:hypothetical protein